MNLNQEMPTMLAATYLNTSYEGAPGLQFGGQNVLAPDDNLMERVRRIQFSEPALPSSFNPPPVAQLKFMPKRIVRVLLVDVDDNVPLDHALLHSTPEQFTDLTDAELYFELPIQELLKKHNAYRVTVLDKKATSKLGKEVFLEPIKIRDLKMTVVTVASFQ